MHVQIYNNNITNKGEIKMSFKIQTMMPIYNLINFRVTKNNNREQDLRRDYYKTNTHIYIYIYMHVCKHRYDIYTIEHVGHYST